MAQRGIHVSRWTVDTLPRPCQKDSTSCGIFALKFAECILKNEPMAFGNTHHEVKDLRWQIANTLLQRTDDLSDQCHLEEQADGDIDWIACDFCLRWFHYQCANKPPKDQQYQCPACA